MSPGALLSAPVNSTSTLVSQPTQDTLNPAADGLSFADVVSIATLLSLVLGMIVIYRRFRDDADKRQKDTIREIVHEVNASVTPKLDTAVHELTNNSGSSVKDKTDSLHRDMSTIRADLASMARSVDKLTTDVGFWVRHTVDNNAERARLGERVAALEAGHQPHTPNEPQSTKGRRRWRS